LLGILLLRFYKRPQTFQQFHVLRQIGHATFRQREGPLRRIVLSVRETEAQTQQHRDHRGSDL
jgi:hypothetical protein